MDFFLELSVGVSEQNRCMGWFHSRTGPYLGRGITRADCGDVETLALRLSKLDIHAAKSIPLPDLNLIGAAPQLHRRSGWTRSGPVRALTEPAFGPAAAGPVRTGPRWPASLFSRTGPATPQLGADRGDRLDRVHFLRGSVPGAFLELF